MVNFGSVPPKWHNIEAGCLSKYETLAFEGRRWTFEGKRSTLIDIVYKVNKGTVKHLSQVWDLQDA